MSSMQMFLVIGGLVLLSFLMINFYSTSDIQYNVINHNEAVITASGIGQSLIEEIAGKAFDEETIFDVINATNLLTIPDSLGYDSGETNRLLFDDIDDYNNYTGVDSLGGMGNFNYKIKIYYGQKLNPNQKSTSRTFTKRADIDIVNAFMQDTLKLNYVYTY